MRTALLARPTALRADRAALFARSAVLFRASIPRSPPPQREWYAQNRCVPYETPTFLLSGPNALAKIRRWHIVTGGERRGERRRSLESSSPRAPRLHWTPS